jgi:beta-glucosidase
MGLVPELESCDAILQWWYDGEMGGVALADILFGDKNPSGRLPITFYRSTDDLPDFLDYSMENRTYRYFRGQPQYAFGYGLSYTTFGYGKGKLSKNAMKANGNVTLTVPVTNTGKVAGDEVVQVYVKALDYPDAPIKSLRGFQKLSLQPGQTANAVITLDGEAFEYYDPSIDELSTRPGRYQILYGSSSREADLQSLDLVVKL